MKKQSARTQIATKKAEREVNKANKTAGVKTSTTKGIEQQREESMSKSTKNEQVLLFNSPVENRAQSGIIKENHAKTEKTIITREATEEKAKTIVRKMLDTQEYQNNGYSGGAALRAELNKELEYDGSPEVVSAEEFEKRAKGKTVLYRGVESTSEKSAKEMTDEFKHGKLWADNSGGARYGRGTYFSSDASIASGYAGSNGDMITMILSEDAKIADFQELYKEFYETGIPTIIGVADEDYKEIIRDIGSYAAVKGYDAIATNGFSGHDYVVLLNRSKAVVKE